MSTVLLVDDDTDAVSSLVRALSVELKGISFHVASSAEDALLKAEKEKPEVAVIDLSLNPEEGVESGFALLKELERRYSALPVIVLTGHGDSTFGVRAMKLGASNFLVKPADIPHLSALIQEGIKQFELRSQVADQEESERKRSLEEELVGTSKAIEELRGQLRFCASTFQPVLLEGETGVGKSLCARLLHRLGKRKDGPFVRYQPGLSRSDILASELFGHLKGAFTGADSDREGLLLKADGGTFFLDEIDGLPLDTQTSLLGVLQEKRFRPVGADTEREVNLRFISATNADVDSLQSEGKLRSDLFHRIAHARIRIPALRERTEDIPLLVQSIVAALQAREEIPFLEFSDASLSKLRGHGWPGNVRELEGVVEGACSRALFDGRSEVSEQDVVLRIESPSQNSSVSGETLHERVLSFKKQEIEKALSQCENNQVQAAKLLGIDRTTLRRILNS